jgi:hypothetical protein
VLTSSWRRNSGLLSCSSSCFTASCSSQSMCKGGQNMNDTTELRRRGQWSAWWQWSSAPFSASEWGTAASA